ncbi:sigma-54-dependent Fis family transcriptional regulator [Thalassomonas viridans]|uniref:Sigma-54-dependent Fis family transcriptional regulator n=1 Tax=Thalassomonas viridans TaxID=137584 RepID=A0AAE9Z2J0_9GAMM|nr:sigma-54 dependent transcriptional regulator [Thalassomonas viridans]WDE04022.1 sigma-54-dependent Fis family transcriptional regulator [Thalassomonas viridans]
MIKVLVADDNPDIIAALDLLLGLHGYQVLTAATKKQALMAVAHQHVDLVIQDMNFAQGMTSGDEGKGLFHELRTLKPELPVILITAWTQLETAVELVKAGAADYLQKPWDDTRLLELVARYSGESQNKDSTVNQRTSPAEDNKAQSQFIYQSREMLALMADAEKVAQAPVNVLITGANGSGKEKLADYLHQHSLRSGAPLIKVNMGAIPQELMEAELFGAEKGAYTGANQARKGRFEAADGGTLFLDEIGNLSLSGQMKLLRVLQTGEFERLGSNDTIKVDVRVLSATNANLQQAIKQGEFREDLFYRLNVIELHLPELKERKADILPLAQYFIGSEYALSDDAKQYLLSNSWPGNVRELENACKRAMVFARQGRIEAADFKGATGGTGDKSEKQQIEQVLMKHGGVIKHAAMELGLSRQALYRRLDKYQIDPGSLG